MRYLFFLLIISVALSSCGVMDDKSETENIELIKNYIHSVETLDFQSMEYFLDENYLGIGPSYGDSIGKIEAIANWKFNVENLYESIKYRRSRFASVIIPDGDGEGEWVTNWSELEIKFKPNSESAIIWVNTNYMVENGKIVKSITFYNEADVLRQLDYMIVPNEWLE